MVGGLFGCGVTADISTLYDCCIAPVGPLEMWEDDTWAAILFSNGLLMLGVWIVPPALLTCEPIGDTFHSSFVMWTVRCVT